MNISLSLLTPSHFSDVSVEVCQQGIEGNDENCEDPRY
jgi:hypothetical protein